MQEPENQLLFHFTGKDGKEYKVYTNGKTEGFPDGISVCHFRSLIEFHRAPLIHISKLIGSYNPSILSWAIESIEEEKRTGK